MRKLSFIDMKLLYMLLIILNVFFMFSVDVTNDAENMYISKIKSSMGDISIQKPVVTKQAPGDFGAMTYIRVVFSLIFVVSVLFLVYYFLRKKQKISGDVDGEILLLSSKSIGASKFVQIVYTSGKYMILGVTNEQITMLGEITDPKEIERLEILYNDRKVKSGDTFNDLFESVFKGFRKKKETHESFDYEEDSVDFIRSQKNRIDSINGDKH